MMLEVQRKSIEEAHSPSDEMWRVTNWTALASSIDAFLELFDTSLPTPSSDRELDREMQGKLQELYEFKW